MAVYEVFQRRAPDEPMVHAGSLEAEDARLAVLLAKECFFRREYPHNVWVVCRDDMHGFDEINLVAPTTDKSYRSIEAYKGIAKKRAFVEASLR